MLTAVISPRCQLKDESGPEREADLGVEPKCLSHGLGVLLLGGSFLARLSHAVIRHCHSVYLFCAGA